MTTLPRVHANALPEHCRFPDTGCPGGCDLSLECPRPICIYDDPDWSRVRDRQIVRLRGSGWTYARVAAAFSVSERTAERVLAAHRKAGGL